MTDEALMPDAAATEVMLRSSIRGSSSSRRDRPAFPGIWRRHHTQPVLGQRDLWWAEQYNVKLLTARGVIVRQFTKGSDVTGLAWDGSHLWLAYDNLLDGSRIEEDTAAGTPIRTFTVPITGLTSLAWADGTSWALGQHDLGSPALAYRLNVPPR